MGIKARAQVALMTIKHEWNPLTHLAQSVHKLIKLFWTVGPFSILLIWSSWLGWPLQGSFNLAINEAENNTSLISNQPAHILNLQFGCRYRPDNISLTKLLFNISDDYQDKLNKNTNILEKRQFKVYQCPCIKHMFRLRNHHFTAL